MNSLCPCPSYSRSSTLTLATFTKIPEGAVVGFEEMFEGDSVTLKKCAAEGLACADPGSGTPIGVSGYFNLSLPKMINLALIVIVPTNRSFWPNQSINFSLSANTSHSSPVWQRLLSRKARYWNLLSIGRILNIKNIVGECIL
jgi:hypothetical protein